MINDSTAIIAKMESLTVRIDQIFAAGFNDTNVIELRDLLRSAAGLLAVCREYLSSAPSGQERTECFRQILRTQSRMVRKCHLSTMAVLSFQSGQLKFLDPKLTDLQINGSKIKLKDR
jgi:hypothetical protein